MLSRLREFARKRQTLPYLIRFSYHKCLTRYMGAIFDKNKHFFVNKHDLVQHIRAGKAARFISINNTAVYPEHEIFANSRMIHLIRHPKDLIISGYYYHKKGSEQWNRLYIPWAKLYKYSLELDHVLNDQERKLLQTRLTYQELLEALPFEKGMMVEMIWLKYVQTFNPLIYYQSSVLPTYRFEEIMEDPVGAVRKICQHWQLTEQETAYYCERADHYNQAPSYPVRDKSAYQYREVYTKELDRFFKQQFNHLVRRLDYPD